MFYKTKFIGSDFRPVIKVELSSDKVLALYDTGASIAVTNIKDDFFKLLDAKLLTKNVKFKGFGGETFGDLYRMYINIGGIIFNEFPIIKIDDDDLSMPLVLPAPMFSEFIVTINNLDKTIEFKNNSNQVCYNMHIGDKVYTGEVMCAEYYSELRNRIIGICGEENCDKVINLLPDITPVLDDVSLRAIVMETLRNGKIK